MPSEQTAEPVEFHIQCGAMLMLGMLDMVDEAAKDPVLKARAKKVVCGGLEIDLATWTPESSRILREHAEETIARPTVPSIWKEWTPNERA